MYFQVYEINTVTFFVVHTGQDGTNQSSIHIRLKAMILHFDDNSGMSFDPGQSNSKIQLKVWSCLLLLDIIHSF